MMNTALTTTWVTAAANIKNFHQIKCSGEGQCLKHENLNNIQCNPLQSPSAPSSKMVVKGVVTVLKITDEVLILVNKLTNPFSNFPPSSS